MRIFAVLLLISITQASFAHPAFFEQYKEHPRALEKADCSICHFDPNGGGKLQEFGLDFAHAEYNITQEILKKYPQKFSKPKQN